MSLDVVQRHAHLLDGTWASAAQVTQRTAWDLRAEYALIRKDTGTRCDGPGGGVDCDKVIHRTTFAVYDCVVNGGAPTNAAAWIFEGIHPDLAGRLVEPVPSGVPMPPTPPVPTPPTLDTRLEALAQAVSELQAQQGVNAQVIVQLFGQVSSQLDALTDLAVMLSRDLDSLKQLERQLVDPGLRVELWSGRITGMAKLPPSSPRV